MALTIAGSDPSGAAGVQVDLQVFRDFGLHGASVLTAVLWQDTTTVHGWHTLPAEVVEAQAFHILEDLNIKAVKLGVLPTASIVRHLHKVLPQIPIVLDPVMANGDGSFSLVEEGVLDALSETLFPRATVLTPNLPEAAALIGERVEAGWDMLEVATQCRRHTGAQGVLLKVGHALEEGEVLVRDVWADASGTRWLTALPLAQGGADVRGTGCQLSSAIAAGLVQGLSSVQAVEKGRRYLNKLLRERARDVGRGRKVVVRGQMEE